MNTNIPVSNQSINNLVPTYERIRNMTNIYIWSFGIVSSFYFVFFTGANMQVYYVRYFERFSL